MAVWPKSLVSAGRTHGVMWASGGWSAPTNTQYSILSKGDKESLKNISVSFDSWKNEGSEV